MFNLKNFKKNLSAIISIVFLAIILIVVFALLWTVFNLKSKINPAGLNMIEIKPGQTGMETARKLGEQGIIKNKSFFDFYLRFGGLDKKIQAGEYNLAGQITVEDLINSLLAGVRKKEIAFTVPEGWTIRQIAELSERKGLVAQAEFLKQAEAGHYLLNSEAEEFFKNAQNSDFIISDKIDSSLIADSTAKLKNKYFSFLDDKYLLPSETEGAVSQNINHLDLEGYLFPDTYQVFDGALASIIIAKMLSNFDRKLTFDLRLEIKKQGKTIYQIVTMASILEREVRSQKDMKIAADIFWRRLADGMPLQADSTLNYFGQNNLGWQAKPGLTYEQLQIDSSYNTYKYKGLPPTPISNPGWQAIEAAIYPAPNKYWYFLSKPSGETVFAYTLAEQEKNKRLFLK